MATAATNGIDRGVGASHAAKEPVRGGLPGLEEEGEGASFGIGEGFEAGELPGTVAAEVIEEGAVHGDIVAAGLNGHDSGCQMGL